MHAEAQQMQYSLLTSYVIRPMKEEIDKINGICLISGIITDSIIDKPNR